MGNLYLINNQNMVVPVINSDVDTLQLQEFKQSCIIRAKLLANNKLKESDYKS